MALVADRREEFKAEISELTVKIEGGDELDGERPTWLSKRFKVQQELEDEEAKWSRYRKDWTDRQKAQRKAKTAPPKPIVSAGLSSQVQDLLKSMTAKGLIPKTK